MLRNPNDYKLGYENMLFLINNANRELVEMIFINTSYKNSRIAYNKYRHGICNAYYDHYFSTEQKRKIEYYKSIFKRNKYVKGLTKSCIKNDVVTEYHF